MNDYIKSRRKFLKGALVGGAMAGASLSSSTNAENSVQAEHAQLAAGKEIDGPPIYEFLTRDEAAFVEALVDHMVPPDSNHPGGIGLGVNIYIDRALTSNWGGGDRMYLQGPWKQGSPSQGYQLALTPAQLYRAGIDGTNEYCRKTFGNAFDLIMTQQREDTLNALESGHIEFSNGLASGIFFSLLYQTIIEGLFSDPIYGGNRDMRAWKMIGFPGVGGGHAQHIVKFKNKLFQGKPLGIADLS